MSELRILEFPHAGLRVPANPVAAVDVEVSSLVDRMFETMYAAKGVGLAAVQVGIPLQIVVADVSDGRDQPLALVNPRIEDREGEQELLEGCLSVPGIYAKIRRAKKIQVSGLDQRGNGVVHEVDDLLSVCLQHEIEHLSGVMFLDHLSRIKRKRIGKTLAKRRASA